MSGPIVPPLEVTEVDGSPDGRPITKLVVSNGDLTISGRTATIDTSGSTTTPGGSTTEIQYNDGGAFAGDAGFVMDTEGDGSTTKIQIGNIVIGANIGVTQTSLNQSIFVLADGTGQVFLQSSTEGGGTFTDTIVNVMCWGNADDATLRLKNQDGVAKQADITLDTNSDLVIDNSYNTDADLDLKISGTGIVEVANQTTDNPTTFQVAGNGTGKPVINLKNDAKSASLEVTTNNELTIAGALNSFTFDVSSATGGITFPDATTQITAASGGGDNFFAVETPDPTLMANSEMAQIPATTMLCGYGAATTGGVSTSTHYYPFIAPHSGDVASVTISVSSSAASTFHDLGIYDNTNGFPDTLIGKATIDVSSTGEVTQTSLSDTVTLAKGTMYWLGWSRESGSGWAELDSIKESLSTGVSFGLGVTSEYGFTSNSNQSFVTITYGALPATVTLADIVATNRYYPIVGLAW